MHVGINHKIHGYADYIAVLESDQEDIERLPKTLKLEAEQIGKQR